MQASIPDTTSVLVVPAPELAREDEFKRYIRRFALMALFAKVVYRQDIPERTRDEMGCDYLKGGIDDFGMPKNENGGGWNRLVLNDGWWVAPEGITPCYNQHGLYFETYVHRRKPFSAPDIAVIAFRGTENYNLYQKMRDWSSNLAAFFGFDPREYMFARYRAIPLIKEIKQRNTNIKIYVTGHSLGGGIAQQIAYISTAVDAAYVFDSTPVTNWSTLMSASLIPHNYNPIVFRVSHTNEFLQGPRAIASRLSTTRINRSDYEFFFQKTSWINDHEMSVLTCNFAKSMENIDGDFDFPVHFAREIMLDRAICPATIYETRQ